VLNGSPSAALAPPVDTGTIATHNGINHEVFAVPNVTATVTNISSNSITFQVTNTNDFHVQVVAASYTFSDITNQTLVDRAVINLQAGETQTVTLKLAPGLRNQQLDIWARYNPGPNYAGSPAELERTDPFEYINNLYNPATYAPPAHNIVVVPINNGGTIIYGGLVG